MGSRARTTASTPCSGTSSGDPLDPVESIRKAWLVIGLTLRYLLGTRRSIAMAVLAAVPLILAVSLAASRVAAYDILLFQSVMVPLFLQVVLIFVTLVNASTLIREEIEDNTLPYLLTRPISKPAIVLYKYLGYLIVVLVLLIPPIVLAYAVTEAYTGTGFSTDSDVLAGFLVATILGSAAYGALFLFISVLVRRPLAVGLLIGFVWESIVGSIPGQVPKLSVIHYLRSILKGMIAVGPLTTYSTDVSAGISVVVLVGFTVAMVVVSMLVFQQMEFRQKA
jgi:ABC-2 type transport system permease protein